MSRKKKSLFLLIWILIAIIIFSPNVFADSVEADKNYSKKYEEWLQLSDEEKAKTIAPLPFNVRNKKNEKNSIFNTLLKSARIPSKYDLRDYIDIEVKDQMNTSECWAFSANSVLETNLAMNNKEEYQFSERHMEYETSQSFTDGENPNALDRYAGDGGTSLTAFTYLSRGSGPILEEDMPFENNENNISINDLATNVTVKKVDDMIYFPNIYKYVDYDGKILYMDANGDEYNQSEIKEIRNQIKEHIMKYGGISTSIYGPNNENFYSEENSSMNLNFDMYSNHAVTIIGWDDNYSRDNFIIKPNKNGAYIVLNSWGNEWGDNGIYYVSYEDFLIESNLRAVTSISNLNYDDIYQYDLSEMYGTIDTKYAGNVFTAKENEKLTEIMIGTWEEQTCNIYVNSQGSDLTVNNLTKITSNVKLKPGYNTIKLENSINLQKDSQFTIVVERLNEGCIGIGVECYADMSFSNSISHEGESFASLDGNNWIDIYDSENMMNFSIKAFTQKDGTNIEIANVKYDGNNCIYSDEASEFTLKFRTTRDLEGQDYNVIITNEAGSDVTNKFNVNKVQVKDRIGKVVISSKDNTNIGNYIVKINLNNKEISYNFEVQKLLDFDENTYMLIQIPDENFYKALKCVLNDEQIIYFLDKDHRLIVRKDIEELELVDSFDYFGRTVESGFDISSLSGIEYFTNLKKLRLKNEKIEDLKPLENLSNLKNLELTRPYGLEKINNLDSIKELNNLENLTLRFCDINDLEFVKNLTKLSYLDLEYNNISDISSLLNLNNLTYLDLFNNKIENINNIGQLENLEKLSLRGNNIVDISAIQNLMKLQDLNLAFNHIEDASVLESYNGRFDLNYNNITIEKNVNNGIIIVEVPKIIEQISNLSSKLYNSEEFTLTNCEWEEYGKSLRIDASTIKECKVELLRNYSRKLLWARIYY